MFLNSFLKGLKEYFILQKTYDKQKKQIIETQFGHTKVYDAYGYLISDSFENGNESVVVSYYQGTDAEEKEKHVLKELRYSKKNSFFCERWYLKDGEEYVVVRGKANDPRLGDIPVKVRFDFFDNTLPLAFPYRALLNAANEAFQRVRNTTHRYDINLGSEAAALSSLLVDICDDERICARYSNMEMPKEDAVDVLRLEQKKNKPFNVSKSDDKKKKPASEVKKEPWYSQLLAWIKKYRMSKPQETKGMSPVVSELKPAVVLEHRPQVEQVGTSVVPAVEKRAEKSMDEIKKDRWETQLLQRMEKHDVLMAQKAKVEASARMKSERKAERLASIEKRLKQNEKAQAILNRKLAILTAVQSRDDWKAFTKEERADYKALNGDLKAKKSLVKACPVTDKEGRKAQMTDLSQDRKLKQISFKDYKTASRATRNANITLRKLRDVKRQDTIFELSYIVREKKALEQALKTEKDMFKYAEMSERLQELKREKVALIRGYRAAKPRKTVKATSIVQPILPGMAQQLSK